MISTSMRWVAAIDKKFYGDYGDRWDDARLRDVLLARINAKSVVLDLGAGIASHLNFRNLASKVCGVDLDLRVLKNQLLDEGRVGRLEELPYDDETFDVVFSNNVLEHLKEPQDVFNEVHRVLKKGGLFVAKTPNKLHYVPVLARLTPSSFHEFINRKRGRAVEDTFPTFYRANSEKEIRRLAKKAGFSIEKLDIIEGRPEYLRLSPITYLMGLAYERIVNSFEALRCFRVVIVTVMVKQ